MYGRRGVEDCDAEEGGVKKWVVMGKSGREEWVGKSEGDVARRDYGLEGGWVQQRHFDADNLPRI